MLGTELKVVTISARQFSCAAGVAKELVCGFPLLYRPLFFLSPSHGGNHFSEESFVTDG